MRRAVVVFVEDNNHLLMQLGCLYTSLKHINASDTDLVVFGTKEALKKVPNDCIKVECEIASDPPEFLNYRFINSISCLVEKQADFLVKYDYILRTDADTFLTPAWNAFYPDFYTVGRGGYVNDKETRSNIRRIASHFNLRHQGLFNLGSTHYGNASLVREVCKLATELTAYILTEEFKSGEGKWPGWYRGVTSMYACEIATNHLVEQLTIDPERLDFGSASEESIQNHPHIHCWHTDNMFSKFHFTAGKYDHLNTKDLDVDIINNYCLSMALKSKEYFDIKA
ncbi:hypothetical protein E3U55_14005 [Filobacillus milosensis]|uniref:DUF7164 domain-containing protein n=1 Tax=Filobacillus milosensis TaxID=94137 RepID=A0A4Y8IL28_9BACI|nr:hypothetical protein [Filobacillus milosensis]TFB14289.1 hypothetical protein E3U55_14005 [Filobacillus milosensis]